jgi:hypothetical protein
MPSVSEADSAHNGWLWVAAVTLLAGLGWGLEQVAVAPLETGEVYPPYSTLRSDPLGARALYESLEALPELKVERLYKSRTVLNADQVLFVLGVDAVAWTVIGQKTLTEYENLLHNGGRLVIAFVPASTPRRVSKDPSRPPEEKSAPNVVADRWHIRVAFREPVASEAGGEIGGPEIPRRSAIYFEPGPEWRTLMQREGQATAVERSLAGGTVVLVSESYVLSNEGLREARDAGFITRLAGPARVIFFDENHFGIVETGSVAGLMRKYHLEAAVAVLAIVSALFLWRSASNFLPPRTSRASEAVAGRDVFEGLAALLRRGVPEKDLLDACYAEWARSAPQENRADPVRAELKELGRKDPVAAYREACRIHAGLGPGVTRETRAPGARTRLPGVRIK